MKFRKFLLVMVCALHYCALCVDKTVYAEFEESSIPEPLVFNLNHDYMQSTSYYDADGLLTTLTISSTPLSGEKKISISNIKYTMSYKIYISGTIPHITSAYDASYSFSIPVTVLSSSLAIDSSVQATYTINFKQGLLSATRWLRVNINSGSIVVTHN